MLTAKPSRETLPPVERSGHCAMQAKLRKTSAPDGVHLVIMRRHHNQQTPQSGDGDDPSYPV